MTLLNKLPKLINLSMSDNEEVGVGLELSHKLVTVTLYPEYSQDLSEVNRHQIVQLKRFQNQNSC